MIKMEDKKMEKINLNKASKEDLMKIDGMKEKNADQLLRYREEHGEFNSIDDLKKIGWNQGMIDRFSENIEI